MKLSNRKKKLIFPYVASTKWNVSIVDRTTEGLTLYIILCGKYPHTVYFIYIIN